MTSKSSRHKSENTYRFQTFHERLAGVNIDVARKFGKFAPAPEDADTFFGEALAKWMDLNLTQHFLEFRREIAGEVHSMNQLVYHQDNIAAALQKHLQVPNSLAFEPILDLLVQFARDLQSDFYPRFESFFNVIVVLLNTYHHDVDVLEKAFTALAYLMKFLWRLMLKDLHVIYKLFSPLLGSQYKDYIHNFAAESLSFLMRKCKHHDELFNFMFSDLHANPSQSSGVGRLLYEMVKGVQNQFHSCTEKVLPVMFEKLGHGQSLPLEEVFTSLSTMLRSMATNTNARHATPLWTALLEFLKGSHSSLSADITAEDRTYKEDHVRYLLQLLHILLTYKDGKIIGDPHSVVMVLHDMVGGPVLLPPVCGRWLLDCISAVLMAENCVLQAVHRPMLLNKVYKSSYPWDLIVDFTKSLFDLAMFEKDVLPCLLGLVGGLGEPSVSLPLLCELLLNKRPVDHSAVLPDRSVYALDMAAGEKHKERWMVDLLEKCMTGADIQVQDVWGCCTCLPHVRPIDEDRCIELLSKVIQQYSAKLQTPDLQDSMDICTTLWQAVHSLYLLTFEKPELFFASVSLDGVQDLLRANPSNPHILRLANFFFTFAKEKHQKFVAERHFETVYAIIKENISSSASVVRLLTLHILCQFKITFPTLPDGMDLAQPGIFRICLDIEQTAVHTTHFREKLRHLQKLQHDIIQNQLPEGKEEYAVIPLRYLLGVLYVNFSMLWQPALKVISTHATGLNRELFWGVFGEYVTNAAPLAEENLFRDLRPAAPPAPITTPLHQLLISHGDGLSNRAEKADHVNFRQLLWKAMQLFPHIVEAKSKVLVPLLFRFLDNEYYPADVMAASTQNISKKGSKKDGEEDEAEESMEVEELQDGKEEEGEENAPKTRRRASNKTLITHMSLFAKFTNPRSAYMEPQLNQMFLKFLTHKDGGVQKAAFDCVMTYKYKYLTPYRDNFEKLLDDKQFKKEIVLFSISEENTVVSTEHRDALMPMLMRVLYGKMYGKTGKDTAGKAHSQMRQGHVLRFLASSQHSEINVFLDLVFEPFMDFMQEDVGAKVRQLLDHVDMTAVLPLGKQHSILVTVDTVFKKLGHKIETYLPKLLRILVCLCSECTYLLQRRHLVSPRFINQLKNLRQMAQGRIVQFFESYDSYPFTIEEVDAVFDSMVWPQLSMLPGEGSYSPTALLKLFLEWTQTIRYFPLLGKLHSDGTSTPLTAVFALLHAKNVHSSVTAAIMELVENLLTMHQDDDERPKSKIATTNDSENELLKSTAEKEDKPIPVGKSVILEPEDGMDVDTESQTPLGIRLVLPHVGSLLDYLRGVVETMVKARKKTPPARELRILSRLSEYVMDPVGSGVVIQLLLPFLGRPGNRSDTTDNDLLVCLTNLIRRVDKPAMFIKPISKLFSMLSTRTSRTGLCTVVHAVAERDATIATLATMVTKLNAWDRKRVEEPDFMERIEGFQDAISRLKLNEEELSIDYLLMLMHNCTYILATTEDMSLRDNACFTMQQLIARLASASGEDDSGGHDTQVFRTVVQAHLLPEIKNRLRLSTEVARHEFINLLASLVKHFPACPLFEDLTQLRNEEDVEVDFFSNMVHIQLHRRARAMKRLAWILRRRRSALRADTLVNVVMPILIPYVRDDAYMKNQNSIQDAAVTAVGAVCRVLPWDRYQTMLKYYLTHLPKAETHQKLMVRVLVAILDNFHYDLRNSRGVHAEHVAVDKEEKKTEEPKETTEKDKEDEKETEMDTTIPEEEKEGEEEEDEEEEKEEKKDSEEDKEESFEEEEEETGGVVPMKICGAGLATRIHRMIVRNIIPQLHGCLTQKVASDAVHKKANAGKFAEDEEILRVPLALAMVKLLQNLPRGSLNRTLPNVLIKVCKFLCSRARDIRTSARDTLLKILQSLGPSYFSFILKELRFCLKRGYQLHVLTYTVWALLNNLDESAGLKPGDLDTCIQGLAEVFNEELFGHLAEEKEVAGIVGKLFEARSSKSYDSYGLVAKYVSPQTLANIVLPLKQVLDDTHSRKVAVKVNEALRKISLGVVENTSLELDTLLTFVYGLTNDALPMMQEQKGKNKRKSKASAHQTGIYIITPEPARGGIKPKTNTNTNSHCVVEFGLQVLNLLLKKGKLVSGNKHHLELLDPFVNSLADSLQAKHIKVMSLSLRCLLLLLRFPLPALKEHIATITNTLFVLLNNYAMPGAAKGDNFELVVMSFKAMTVLVRDIHYHTITPQQLQVLLGYAEADLHDYSRQATAFSLIKAILHRRLQTEDMHDVIGRIEKLSITAEQANVRMQCRQVVLQFLLDYPLGKKLSQHLEFYVRQLDYEMEHGRVSVLEMIASMIAAFPQKYIVEYSGFFFVPLVSRLVNDESMKCRKLTALAIKSLLAKLESGERDKLFSMCVQWLEDSKTLVRKLSATACGLFVEVETAGFERHLSTLLPILQHQIHPERYSQNGIDEVEEKAMDQLLFSLLTLLIKVLRECDVIRKPKWIGMFSEIWVSLELHCNHPHSWVQLASAQLLGLLFAAWSAEDVSSRAIQQDNDGTEPSAKKQKSIAAKQEYLAEKTHGTLHTLCGCFLRQLQGTDLEQELADQVVKNLVFLGKVLQQLPAEESTKGSKRTSFSWLLMKMCREARLEVSVGAGKITTRRCCVLKWLAAVSLDLGVDGLKQHLPTILAPVVREFNNNAPNADEALITLAGEVIELLKSIVGLETFSKEYAVVQKKLGEKRNIRKRERAQEAIAEPEKAARRKIKKHLNKKEAKKRKVEEKRPGKMAKRKKTSLAEMAFIRE